MKYNDLLILGVASVAFAVTGCNSKDHDDLLKNARGSYEGLVINKSSAGTTQVPISGDFSASSSRNLAMHVATGDSKSVWDFQVEVLSDSKVQVSGSIFKDAVELTKDGNNCFASSDGGSSLRLCFDGSELSLDDVIDSSHESIFVLDHHVASEHPVLEAPKTYTVADLLEAGKNKSFTSEVQFQASVQSRENAVTAHYNLFPQLSYGNVVGAISFQLANTVGLIGDLAPFIIPSNWIAASSAKHQSDGDYYAYLLMKANSANIAEGLAYAALRDNNILPLMKSYEQPLTDMIKIIHDQQALGLLPKGADNALSAILQSLHLGEVQLQETITEETRSLAAAVGLENPDGIAGITDVSEAALNTPPPTLTLQQMQDLAIDRSMELRQVDAMSMVSKDTYENDKWSWVSPSGNLGLGLPSQIQSGKAGVAELVKERDLIQSTVLQKVENASSQVATELQAYKIAKANETNYQSQLDQLVKGLKSGLAVNVADLELAITNKMAGDTSLVSAKYSYYIALGVLNRCLLDGPYLDILTQVGDNKNATRP